MQIPRIAPFSLCSTKARAPVSYAVRCQCNSDQSDHFNSGVAETKGTSLVMRIMRVQIPPSDPVLLPCGERNITSGSDPEIYGVNPCGAATVFLSRSSMYRVPGFEPGGCRRNSCRENHSTSSWQAGFFSRVAQSSRGVALRTSRSCGIVGQCRRSFAKAHANPTAATIFRPCSPMQRRQIQNLESAGANPAMGTSLHPPWRITAGRAILECRPDKRAGLIC